MRNLLALLAACTLTVAVVGWFLGWYQVRSLPAPDGQRSYNIQIDTLKVKEDIHKGREKLHDLLETPEKDREPAGKNGSGSAAALPDRQGPVATPGTFGFSER